MLIPQGMAYAVIAGMPPVYGLYASIVPLIVYAVFGTSRQLSVAPVAMVSILVAAGVGEFADPGSERFIKLAILTAFGVGTVMLFMGLFRLGFLVNFLSRPVLSGFTSAAAVIIGASQLKGLFGFDFPRTSGLHELVAALFANFDSIQPVTALIGIISVIFLFVSRTLNSRLPAALVLLLLSTIATSFLELEKYGLSVVGEIPGGLPQFRADIFSLSDIRLLIPTILVISLIGYMESIAVARAIAEKRDYSVDPNQELRAVGLANIAGSLFQSFPVAGGFSRTAVNDQSGAVTGIASVISALLIALTVLVFTPVFYHLPKTVLAAIIVVAVSGLFDFREMSKLWRTDKRDFLMLLVTFCTTLAFGVEIGIASGVVISLVAFIYISTIPHSAVLGRLGSTRNFRNVNRYKEAVVDDEILIYRFDSQLYFANAGYFNDTLVNLVKQKGDQVNLVILDASAINIIDSTGVHTLKKIIGYLDNNGVRFYVAGAIGPVRDKLKSSGIVSMLGEKSFFFEVADAVDFYKNVCDRNTGEDYSPVQTNC